MPEFQLINEKRFPLQIHDKDDNVDLLPYFRWEHRVTIGYRGKRLMVFLDNLANSAYIEDITSGTLKKIEDDPLWEAAFKWATEKGYLTMLSPLQKPAGYSKSNTQMRNKAIKV